MMRTLLITLFLVSLFVIGCSAEPEVIEVYTERAEIQSSLADEDSGFADTSNVPADLDIERAGGNNRTQQRLIIKTGSLSIEVADIDAALNDATGWAVGIGGYTISQELSGNDHYRSAMLTLGVPVDEFEATMAALRELGRVEVESITGEDVTEEYVDLNSRMTNLTATQERMRALLAEATNVEDTLMVDRELRRIEEEMNVIQGRIEFLSEQAAFSTITLYLSYEAEAPLPELEAFNIGRTAQEAVLQLRDTFSGLLEATVYFGIVCGPWVLLLGLGGWFVRGILDRRHTATTAQDDESS